MTFLRGGPKHPELEGKGLILGEISLFPSTFWPERGFLPPLTAILRILILHTISSGITLLPPQDFVVLGVFHIDI